MQDPASGSGGKGVYSVWSVACEYNSETPTNDRLPDSRPEALNPTEIQMHYSSNKKSGGGSRHGFLAGSAVESKRWPRLLQPKASVSKLRALLVMGPGLRVH